MSVDEASLLLVALLILGFSVRCFCVVCPLCNYCNREILVTNLNIGKIEINVCI